MTIVPSSTQRTVLYGVALLGGFAACEESTNPADAPLASACLIQRMDVESISSSSNMTAQTLYTYDDARNLTRMTHQTATTYTDGALETSYSVNTDYTYDSEGYLTKTTRQTIDRASRSVSGGGPTQTQRSLTTTYGYTSGRVTSYTTVETQLDNRPLTRLGSYSYNGDQTQQVETSSTGFSRTYVYTKGLLTDYIERTGSTEIRPWTLKNGLITKMTLVGNYLSEITYEYDEQQRLIRRDEFLNGKPTGYTIYTNDPAKPGAVAVPAQKGFPDVVPVFGRPALETSQKQYSINLNGQTQFYMDLSATHQANRQGFVTKRSVVSRPQNPQALPQMITTTETYTYTNCP